MNKEEYKDYLKLSGKITEKLDNTATYENWLIIQEYIDRAQQKVEQLEKENKILKDTILKALEFINNHTYRWKDTQFGEMVEVEDFEPGLKPIELINILKNEFENKKGKVIVSKKIIKCLKNSIGEKGNYCYSLPVETTKAVIKELNRLNNIINEAIGFTNSHFKEMVADEEAQALLNILNKGENNE